MMMTLPLGLRYSDLQTFRQKAGGDRQFFGGIWTNEAHPCPAFVWVFTPCVSSFFNGNQGLGFSDHFHSLEGSFTRIRLLLTIRRKGVDLASSIVIIIAINIQKFRMSIWTARIRLITMMMTLVIWWKRDDGVNNDDEGNDDYDDDAVDDDLSNDFQDLTWIYVLGNKVMAEQYLVGNRRYQRIRRTKRHPKQEIIIDDDSGWWVWWW